MPRTANIKLFDFECTHCKHSDGKKIYKYQKKGNEFKLHECSQCHNLSLIRFPVVKGDEVATIFKVM